MCWLGASSGISGVKLCSGEVLFVELGSGADVPVGSPESQVNVKGFSGFPISIFAACCCNTNVCHIRLVIYDNKKILFN